MSNINFNIDFAKTQHVPHVKEPTFCVVIRKRVRATAIGPNTVNMQNIGENIGKFGYSQSVPEIPLNMPIEFRELYNHGK